MKILSLAVAAIAVLTVPAASAATNAELLAFHLDFNTLQYRKDTVIGLLRHVAAEGYNAILWEVEDKIKWETCPET